MSKLKVKHENLKCMGIMQDDLRHPYYTKYLVIPCAENAKHMHAEVPYTARHMFCANSKHVCATI